jgi:pentatricopeptide repeat protein
MLRPLFVVKNFAKTSRFNKLTRTYPRFLLCVRNFSIEDGKGNRPNFNQLFDAQMKEDFQKFQNTPHFKALRRLTEARKHGVQEIFKTYEDIQKEGVKVDTTIYNSLLLGLKECGDFAALKAYFAAFQNMKMKPNSTSFKIIMEGYIDVGDLSGAIEIYHEMKKRGVKINEFIYEMLLWGVHKTTVNAESELELINELVAGVRESKIPMNTRIYNVILKSYLMRKDVSSGEQIWAEMKEQGVEPDEMTFNCLLTAFAMSDIDKMEKCFLEMKTGPVQPTPRAYHLILGGFARAGKIEKVKAYFADMQQSNVQPEYKTTQLMIQFQKQFGK